MVRVEGDVVDHEGGLRYDGNMVDHEGGGRDEGDMVDQCGRRVKWWTLRVTRCWTVG